MELLLQQLSHVSVNIFLVLIMISEPHNILVYVFLRFELQLDVFQKSKYDLAECFQRC